MNFLFIDRILAIEPGKHTLALKHVTASDAYLFKNASNQIALYSCIVGEALGQLCSWNVIQATEYTLRLIGGVVESVILHRDPLLGETVILENHIEMLDTVNNVCHFHGSAKVGDETIFELHNGLGPIMPIAEFGNVETVKKEYHYLYRPGTIPLISEGRTITDNLSLQHVHLQYDRILEWTKGESVCAQKNISLTAPYFHDHFPLRPIFPVTLMIQSNLLLAHLFLNELISPGEQLRPVAVRRIKMNDFVLPGTIITTHLQLKSRESNRFIITFRSGSDNKRICVCEAEFEVTPL